MQPKSKSGQSYKEPKTAYMYNMMAQVPVMMQAALQRGAMSAAELQQWLALAAKPILGALSRCQHDLSDPGHVLISCQGRIL